MDAVRLPNAGDRFLDVWLIGEEVGKGGFSVVYRAVHDDGRVAALKVLTPEASSKVSAKSYQDEVADRFLREARLLDQLDSAYTIRLWDYGESPDKLLYMIFEFIDGRMLFDEIKEHGALQHDRVVHVLRQTLIALESAHALGILHRDIKPNNIMLYERDGDADRVKLVDFGIAKSFDEDKALPGNDLTAAGLLVGTPRYMSPEQLKGMDLGPPADLYSLGLCAIEMLSGRKCIPGRDRIKIVEQQLGPAQIMIPDDVEVDPALARIVHRLTEKKLPGRYATATEALRDLEALAGDPGATGDTVYEVIPADLGVLLSKPADESDDTVFETVNTAELAALIDQQRRAAVSPAEAESEGTVDPFDETMASRELVPPDLRAHIEHLRATESTVEAPKLDLQVDRNPPSFGALSGDDGDDGGFQSSFDELYGSGSTVDQSYMNSPSPSPEPPPSPASQSYGSGQFPQPPPPAGQSYGSGQFQQPPPASQSYGSGQFQQPPGPHGSGQFQQPPPANPYGSGQFQQPAPPGQAYGSGQFQQPPMGGYGSGQYQQMPPESNYMGGHLQQPPYGTPPPFGQPGHHPPGPYNQGPPQQHPRLTGDDKLALGAAVLVPGVGQIIAGQVVKGGIIMVMLLLLVVFVSWVVWLVLAPLALADTFLLVRAQKRRPVGSYEFFADFRDLL